MLPTRQITDPGMQVFRDIFDASPIGIAVENLEGQPLFANRTLCSMLGFSEEEMRNKDCNQFSPAEDSQKDRALFQQLRAGIIDHYQLEKRYLRRDGTLIWGRLSISLLNSSPSALVVAMVEDISDKKKLELERERSEASLRESEERLRLAVKAARMFAYSWDAATDVIEFSGESAEILGIGNRTATTRAATASMVHPDDKERLDAALATLSVENPNLHITYRNIRPDGAVIWLDRNSVAYFDEKGKVRRLVGMIVDVTERKQTEQALREGEEKFRLAAQVGKMYAYEWDVSTDLVVRSGDTAAVLGPNGEARITRQEIMARVHPDDKAQAEASVTERTPENPDARFTYRVLGADGSIEWFEKTGHAFFDENRRLVRMIGMVSNITERKRSEEKLRESEEKFRSIFQDAGVGMIIVSPEGRFLAANPTFCDYLGYTEQELLEKTVQSVTYDEDWPNFSRRFKEALAEGRNFRRVEKRCVQKNGGLAWTENTAFVVRSPDGHPKYLVGVVLDIRKRKEAEEALSTVNRRLIEAQEQERKRIGRDLHDDINQRLALLAVDLDQLQRNLPELAAETLPKLNEFKDRITEICTGVQSISRQLHSPQLEFLGVAEAMKNFCREFAEKRGVEVDFAQDNIPDSVSHETSLCLFRVLQEALHNAAKHSQVRRFEVAMGCSNGQLHLMITDRGKGFDPQTAVSSGGLGLISMRERVRIVNGTFVIDSKPKYGTTIHVSVPVHFDHASKRVVE